MFNHKCPLGRLTAQVSGEALAGLSIAVAGAHVEAKLVLLVRRLRVLAVRARSMHKMRLNRIREGLDDLVEEDLRFYGWYIAANAWVHDEVGGRFRLEKTFVNCSLPRKRAMAGLPGALSFQPI